MFMSMLKGSRKRNAAVALVVGILALAGAGVYNAQGRVPCVLEGIPQPCWVCNTCGVRPDVEPEPEKVPVLEIKPEKSPAPTPSPIPSITPVRG